MLVVGTRPEAIKMAPVIDRLRRTPAIESVLVSTSQHREMLRQVLSLYDIEPDYDLDIMTANQSLSEITKRSVVGLSQAIEETGPDVVLVQGDTTTAFVGSLIAFYHQVKVGHVEAGLRSHDKQNPFPEEVNRRLISVTADVHFAPTRNNYHNLIKEGIAEQNVFVTGNTVIDALLDIVRLKRNTLSAYVSDEVFARGKRTILVTAHRRENWGADLENMCLAIQEITESGKNIEVVFPVHLNPNVKGPVFDLLDKKKQIHLVEPLPYEAFVEAMSKAYLILTDSGGVQEEAPSLGKPALVMRKVTERPEGVRSGSVKIIGTEKEIIVEEALRLLTDEDAYMKMAKAANPYGDGRASERIVNALLYLHGLAKRPEEFAPPET
jgi:UDP-N-acetylglucosamine 2-epimerase (non-hydrolysing)